MPAALENLPAGRARSIHANRHDINTVVLLMVDGRGQMPQQPQGELLLKPAFFNLISQTGHLILKVLTVSGGASKLQYRGTANTSGIEGQPSSPAVSGLLLTLNERDRYSSLTAASLSDMAWSQPLLRAKSARNTRS